MIRIRTSCMAAGNGKALCAGTYGDVAGQQRCLTALIQQIVPIQQNDIISLEIMSFCHITMRCLNL